MKKKTIDEFINDAVCIHGNLFDYSESEYVRSKIDIKIKCNVCGKSFYMTPFYHINGKAGCPHCKRLEYAKELIEKFNIIHDNKYEYCLENICNTSTVGDKIKVFCKYHGEYFYINISNHLNGSGCQKCGINLLTLDDFIKLARIKHSEKYCYDKVILGNSSKKVEIFCRFHEKYFWQTPKNHLLGQGCPYCAKVKKKTTEEFIEESIKIHGDKYRYDKTIYKNCRSDVIIFCNTHQEYFSIKADYHLNGYGCQKCNILKPVTFEEFVKRAQTKHGDIYNYDINDFINTTTLINIFCTKHGGYFTQTPTAHMTRSGCPICSKNRKKTLEEFIEDSVAIHGDLYDYSNVEYINCRTKVKILCKFHNEIFEQTADVHLRGKGCPLCSNSKGEVKVRNKLISLNIKYEPQYKNSGCFYKNLLRFDFGIFNNFGDLVGIIEYNGAQHYKPFDFSRNKNEYDEKIIEEFEILQKKDNIKRQWCKDNNIPMLELKFDEDTLLENNIELFLTKIGLYK